MLLTFISAAALIGLDQLFKVLAVQYLAPVGAVTVIPGILEFRYFENSGAAFGIFQGKQTFLIVITALALLVALYILIFRRPKNRMEHIAIVMIFAGGVGNLIDRIVNQYVVDYISFLFFNFAIFNFADMLVTFGFALLVITVFRSEMRTKKQEKTSDALQSAEHMMPTAQSSDLKEASEVPEPNGNADQATTKNTDEA